MSNSWGQPISAEVKDYWWSFDFSCIRPSLLIRPKDQKTCQCKKTRHAIELPVEQKRCVLRYSELGAQQHAPDDVCLFSMHHGVWAGNAESYFFVVVSPWSCLGAMDQEMKAHPQWMRYRAKPTKDWLKGNDPRRSAYLRQVEEYLEDDVLDFSRVYRRDARICAAAEQIAISKLINREKQNDYLKDEERKVCADDHPQACDLQQLEKKCCPEYELILHSTLARIGFRRRRATSAQASTRTDQASSSSSSAKSDVAKDAKSASAKGTMKKATAAATTPEQEDGKEEKLDTPAPSSSATTEKKVVAKPASASASASASGSSSSSVASSSALSSSSSSTPTTGTAHSTGWNTSADERLGVWDAMVSVLQELESQYLATGYGRDYIRPDAVKQAKKFEIEDANECMHIGAHLVMYLYREDGRQYKLHEGDKEFLDQGVIGYLSLQVPVFYHFHPTPQQWLRAYAAYKCKEVMS